MENPANDRDLHETKAGIYETWAAVNRAFEQIANALGMLQKIGVLNIDHAQDQDTLTKDLWARINTQIMAGVSRREEDDRTHYGKMRATLERRIRGRQ
jgi:predicted transcriptional regulator